MESLYIKAMIGGVLFGIWPVLMNRSGLTGNVSSLVLSFLVFIVVTPFGLNSIKTVGSDVGWVPAVIAGLAAGIGLLFFNDSISLAKPTTIGNVCVVMLLAQISAPMIYQTIATQGVSLSKVVGLVMAVTSAVILTK